MKRYHAELFCKHSNQSITGQLAYAAVFAKTQEYARYGTTIILMLLLEWSIY